MSSTAWLNNDNSVIQFFDSAGNVGIGLNNPQAKLHSSGTIRTDASLYVGNGTVQSGTPLVLTNPTGQLSIRSNNTDGVVISGSNMGVLGNFSNMGNIITSGKVGIGVPNPSYAVEIAGALKLVNNGQTNHLWVSGGHFYTTYPMVMNAGQGTFIVRSNDIDCLTMAGSNMTVSGTISCVGYCNLLVDSFISSATNRAPTALALSNVYSMNSWTSNTALWASNASVIAFNDASWGSNTAKWASNVAIPWSSNAAIFGSNTSTWASNIAIPWTSNNAVWGSNTAYWSSNTAISASNKAYSMTWASTPQKLIKSLDSSNAINMNVMWETPSTNNSYYIMLDINQNIANQTACGIRRKRIAISTSNYGIAYDQMADTFGSSVAFSTLNLAVTASNSTSCTLTSTTNWVTTGTMNHVFSAEVLGAPTTLGAISLS